MENLEIRLEIETEQSPDTPFYLRFVLLNANEFPIFVLTDYTPLEGLHSDCLEVLWNGEPIPYDGPLIKRAPVSRTSYVEVAAGETIETTVDLSECYVVSAKGGYEISFSTGLRDVISAEEWHIETFDGRESLAPIQPAVKPVSFVVKTSGRGRATSGAIARARREEREKNRKPIDSDRVSLLSAKDPTLDGGTSARKAQTKQAHEDGYTLSKNALSSLANNADYNTWFGAHTSGRFNTVKSVYTKTKNGFETTTFTYHLDPGSSCQPSYYAYTYFGSDEIWLCGAFWGAPANGTDSKAGVVLHEHTHASANTDDHAYGQDDCKALAQSNPSKAIDNADSFEYHAGG